MTSDKQEISHVDIDFVMLRYGNTSGVANAPTSNRLFGFAGKGTISVSTSDISLNKRNGHVFIFS